MLFDKVDGALFLDALVHCVSKVYSPNKEMATVSTGFIRILGCGAGVFLNIRANKGCMWPELAYTTQVSPLLAPVTLIPCILRIRGLGIRGLGIHLLRIRFGSGFGHLHPFGRSQ